MRKNFAFTLSELLVAMGIIGVIAAMTIPGVVNNYQNNAQIVQLRKIVNELNTAADLLITEEGKQNFKQTSAYNNINGFIEDKLKTTKSCASGSTSDCFAGEKYMNINGTEADSQYACSGTSYLLASSAAICAKKDGDYIIFQVDTNGNGAPNIGGRDMFELVMDTDGTITNEEITVGEIKYNEDNSGEGKNQCIASQIGRGCYTKLVNNNWKMNY